MSAVVDAVCLLAVTMCRHPHHANKHDFFFFKSQTGSQDEGRTRSEEHALAMMCPGRFKHT